MSPILPSVWKEGDGSSDINLFRRAFNFPAKQTDMHNLAKRVFDMVMLPLVIERDLPDRDVAPPRRHLIKH